MSKLIPKLQNGQSSTYIARQELIPRIPYKLKDNERWINGQIVQLKDEQIDNQSNEPQVLKEERSKQITAQKKQQERHENAQKGLENFGGFMNFTSRFFPSQIAEAIKEGQTFGGYVANGNKGIGGNVVLNTAFDAGVGIGVKALPIVSKQIYNYAIDKTIGDFNLSYFLNKNRSFNKNRIGEFISSGGESSVFVDTS